MALRLASFFKLQVAWVKRALGLNYRVKDLKSVGRSTPYPTNKLLAKSVKKPAEKALNRREQPQNAMESAGLDSSPSPSSAAST